ncbi:MAG: hypothetical protein C4532_14605 [Candidatus Abyssobacteria bacterium SURF_17]|jgi:hypothetical protein|uniref:Uncharacterized protein n=1 Tax=Candidatus Abyssobacteria bacterium SURF_17 TaxID=2093361 RepID=A0A419ETU6_9BACT|nr:MAG: hypothetical protein C4532_14605 [Candidatus Abyssubacteria bacterium SURF_17]
MPTQAVPEILEKSLDPKLAKVLAQFSSLLEETVNYGTHILKLLVDATQKGSDEVQGIVRCA